MIKYSEKIFMWIDPATIEEMAIQQIENISEMPFIKHVAVMPDCHVGKGATVGTVIGTEYAIIPAAVGVDIGCGIIAVLTNLAKEDILKKDLSKIREGIERRIPLSAGHYNTKLSNSAEVRCEDLETKALLSGTIKRLSSFGPMDNWKLQLGTLGSGNHFIEISLDEQDRVWAILHSGSRGVGNKLATYHIDIAKKIMKDNFIDLKDPDLAYIPEGNVEAFANYMNDLAWAQEFALANREEMMDRVLTELQYTFGLKTTESFKNIEIERIQCHHNFTQKENHFGKNLWITRKGAIQAREGQWGIIPGSMATETYLVKGLGNKMSFESSPHGAGRHFSRGEARKRFKAEGKTMEDFKITMAGIECRPREALIDELPTAYKDINIVMQNALELVEPVHTLKQIVNVKGD